MRIEYTTVRLPGRSLGAQVRPGGETAPTGIVWFEAGLGLDSSLWTAVLERLDAREELDTWSFLAADRAGLGASSPGGREPRLSWPLRDADELLAQTWPGPPTPLVLVGHSWGGTLQRLWSAAHPGAATAAVLVDSSWEGGPEHPGHHGLASLPRLLERSWQDMAESLLRTSGARHLLPTTDAQVLELRRFVPSLDLLEHLGARGRDWMPQETTLVTTCRHDAQAEVQERFAAERGWRVVTSTTGSHMIPREDPDTVAAAVVAALAQCTPMVAV